MLLPNPGPVTLTERVRRSLLRPDLCPVSDTVFRISTMGNLTSADVDRLVQCFSEAIPLGA